MTITYGLIGCGMMGREHIRNIALLSDARVGVVYDPVAEISQAASALAGGAAIASSLKDLVQTKTLDALIIASPNFKHVEQLVEIANIRALPILCEKPLYTKPDDRPVLQKLMADYAAPIWVAMEYRYMPPIARFLTEAKQVTGGIKMLTIKEHRIPFLEKVGDWNRFNENTGGTLVEKCCHFFDLMRLILKAEPVRVMASAGQITNHLDEAYDGRTPDIWDGGYVTFDFDNGARAMLELSMFADGTKWNEELSAVGPEGKIECRLPGPQRFWPEERLGPSPEPEIAYFPRSPKHPTTLVLPLDETLIAAGDHHGSTFHQHERFLAMIQQGGAPDVTLDDGIKAVEMGLAAQTSALETRMVDLV